MAAMRTSARAALTILLACAACDKDERARSLAESVAGEAAPPPPPPEAGPSAADAAPAPSITMPERPIPRPQTTVSMRMPEDVQLKASAYMAAMRSARPDDPTVDAPFANDLVTKLKPILLAADKGPDKARLNRVDIAYGGRQIDLLMSQGCEATTPKNIVASRANVPLSTLLSHGILVVRCNDTKIQCLQSIRDPDDVLCTTAIRH